MTSRFVAAGPVDGEAPGGQQQAGQQQEGTKDAPRNAQWEAAKRQLEEERKQREEQRVKAASGEEKSLYDILQANKAAKQAAFEEQNKIRNQFRALDDDEIEFLDEVKQKQRKEEEARRREMEDGLKAFREAQKGGTAAEDKSAGEGETEGEGPLGADESWSVGQKRKRVVKGKDGKGLNVRRKTSGAASEDKGDAKDGAASTSRTEAEGGAGPAEQVAEAPAGSTKPATMSALGLVGYGSDDSSDE